MKLFRLMHAAHTVRTFMYGHVPYPVWHQIKAVERLRLNHMSINYLRRHA